MSPIFTTAAAEMTCIIVKAPSCQRMLQPKKATDDDYDDNNGDSGSGSRNTWAAIGIPGNWEAGGTHLGSHRNTQDP